MASIFKEKFLRSNTILYCENFNRTMAFYRDILNLAIHYETDWFVEFKLRDQTYLSVADASRATVGSAKGGGTTLSFQVEDVDRAHALLCDLGLKTSGIKRVWESRAFYIYDPEGHRIELWS